MKKIILLIIAITLVLSTVVFTGCGSAKQESISEQSSNQPSGAESSSPESSVVSDSLDDVHGWDNRGTTTLDAFKREDAKDTVKFQIENPNGEYMRKDNLTKSNTAGGFDSTDKLIVAVAGLRSDDDQSFDETKFPTGFKCISKAYEKSVYYQFVMDSVKIESAEKKQINGYDMIKYKGTLTFEYRVDKSKSYDTTYTAYATTLKANGATVCWMIMNNNRNNGSIENNEMVEYQADKMAETLKEITE